MQDLERQKADKLVNDWLDGDRQYDTLEKAIAIALKSHGEQVRKDTIADCIKAADVYGPSKKCSENSYMYQVQDATVEKVQKAIRKLGGG